MGRGGALLSVPRSVEQLSRILSCGLTPLQRARLTDATRSSAIVSIVDSPDDLIATLHATVGDVDVIAIGPLPGDRVVEGLIRRVRQVRPQIPIVVYLSDGGDRSSTLPSLTQAGAHEIIIPGFNDYGARLLAAMTAARRGCAERWLLARLATVVPPRLIRFAEAIIAEPDAVDSVPALANRVGVHRKTLYNWCELTRFFPPGELLLWCRLALAVYYLETTRCSVDTVARDAGFPTPTAFRNSLKRYVGQTATQLREGGGLNYFMPVFAEALARFRTVEPTTDGTQRLALHVE
jgi:AraC-like DNA-binding protein